jgi:hypothetical protein
VTGAEIVQRQGLGSACLAAGDAPERAWAVNGRQPPPVRRMLLAAAGPAVLAAGGCTTHAFVAQVPVGRTPASFPDRAGLATLAAHAIALTEQRLRRTRRGCSLGEAVVTTSAEGTARVTARRCEAGAGIDRAGHQPLPIHASSGHVDVVAALLEEEHSAAISETPPSWAEQSADASAELSLLVQTGERDQQPRWLPLIEGKPGVAFSCSQRAGDKRHRSAEVIPRSRVGLGAVRLLTWGSRRDVSPGQGGRRLLCQVQALRSSSPQRRERADKQPAGC